jgi:predicted phage replisome organizer
MRGQYDMEHVNDTSKYYWLKLERGFFKRHDITIIENYGGYPDGQLMVNLYMRLLAESIDHNGNLRFSAEKPYNNLMLSAITGLDIKVVEKGMECFKEFELIKVLNDGTIFMTKVEKMLGVGSSTERVRAYRERQKEVQKNDVVNEDVEVEEEKKSKAKTLKEPTMKNDELFEQFWSVYPRKVGKDKCQKWFKIRKITQ